VKLAWREPETDALVSELASAGACVSSEVLDVELRCVAHRLGGAELLARMEAVLAGFDLLPFTAAVRSRAGEAFEPAQRALDAIHLGTALDLQFDNLVLVSYDRDQLAAGRSAGLAVSSPS
jgi:predicted nucleic acid-binding protein